MPLEGFESEASKGFLFAENFFQEEKDR